MNVRGPAAAPFIVTNAEYVSKVPLIVAALPGKVDDALREGAERIAESARNNINSKSGDLERSIDVVPAALESWAKGYRVTAGNGNAPYASFVELGSVHNRPPTPYLMPAFDEHAEGILDSVNDVLGDL